MASSSGKTKMVAICIILAIMLVGMASADETCVKLTGDLGDGGCICSKNCACAGKCILNKGAFENVSDCFVNCVLKNDCRQSSHDQSNATPPEWSNVIMPHLRLIFTCRLILSHNNVPGCQLPCIHAGGVIYGVGVAAYIYLQSRTYARTYALIAVSLYLQNKMWTFVFTLSFVWFLLWSCKRPLLHLSTIIMKHWCSCVMYSICFSIYLLFGPLFTLCFPL